MKFLLPFFTIFKSFLTILKRTLICGKVLYSLRSFPKSRNKSFRFAFTSRWHRFKIEAFSSLILFKIFWSFLTPQPRKYSQVCFWKVDRYSLMNHTISQVLWPKSAIFICKMAAVHVKVSVGRNRFRK